MTAEGLKTLYEAELRHELGNPGLGSEERQGLSQLLSASRRMHPGELREQDHAGIWLWSDVRRTGSRPATTSLTVSLWSGVRFQCRSGSSYGLCRVG